MNTRITKSTMLIALLGLSSQLFAQETPTTTTSTGRFSPTQFRTWSIGVHGGVLSPNTIFNGKDRDFQTANEKIGYGGYIKKQILPSLGIQADFLTGKVEGLRAVTGGDANGNYTYNNNSSFETRIQWSGAVSAVWNVANISINKADGVLIPYIKGGAGYMSSGATTTGTPVALTDQGSYREGWFVPVGAGFKLAVSKGINLDFGYDVNFVKSDKFDGYNIGGYDRFSYGHAGLEFAIGDKSKPQLQNYSSLANLNKQTADESSELRRALSTAEENAARDRAQYAKDLADDDNDGVANKFDKCPGTASGTTVDGAGCPLAAPKPQIIKETRVITEEDRRVVKDAISNLEFDLGKSTIRSKSNATLNRVAALLVEKNFSLKLAGHTDNTGGRELNLRLSKERAESVKAYLVAQGVNASRVEATGYGPDQPISTNKTAAGRQENRRVEFTLY